MALSCMCVLELGTSGGSQLLGVLSVQVYKSNRKGVRPFAIGLQYENDDYFAKTWHNKATPAWNVLAAAAARLFATCCIW